MRMSCGITHGMFVLALERRVLLTCAATLPLRKSPCCGRVPAMKIAGTGRIDRWPGVALAEGRGSPLGVGRRQEARCFRWPAGSCWRLLREYSRIRPALVGFLYSSYKLLQPSPLMLGKVKVKVKDTLRLAISQSVLVLSPLWDS
jgi:hypothetical protein